MERYGSYDGPIFAASDREAGPLPILADEFVTTEDGTGIVHLAPAFGEDDYRVAAPPSGCRSTRRARRRCTTRCGPTGPTTIACRDRDGATYEGRFVKDPELTQELIEDLRARGLLLRVQDYEHSYPHCWRCGTPLLYYAKPSWYIATSRLRDELLAANETVSWHPPHVKHGRFGDWLKNNVDWALSRERYWGTPLPVWRCAERARAHRSARSLELAELSGRTLADHHRPYVDELTFPCRHDAEGSGEPCGEPMTRVPEVIDVWFDSGAMPFAQHHFPFENERAPAGELPGGLRLRGAGPDARLVLLAAGCGDADETIGGRRRHRRAVPQRGVPGPDPRRGGSEDVQVQGQYGRAVAGSGLLRRRCLPLVLLHVQAAVGRLPLLGADDRRGGTPVPQAAVVDVLLLRALRERGGAGAEHAPAANVAGGPNGASAADGPAGDLDRWALSRTAGTAELVAERLDAYDATSAGRAIASLVDELSNWYVRRSRRRFWDGDAAAFQTLRTCLLTISKLLAPLCPFIADEIYDNLDGTLASVHLCDFPTGEEIGTRDEGLEQAMALARETVRMGLGARGKAKIKVRQPLSEVVVVADGREREAIERLSDVVREELNVRRVRFVAAADELGSYEVKANYRTLGPLFGKDMPLAAEAIAALDPARVAAAVLAGADGDTGADGTIGIAVAGRDHTLSAADLLLTMRAPDGYSVEREGAHAVALDLAIDGDLRREGRSREIVHAVQNARKSAGLQVEDRIELVLDGDPALIDAAETHRDYLVGETLAVELHLGAGAAQAAPSMDYTEQAEVDGLPLSIGLRTAG